ncbi:MAG: BREX-1 system adenine-specific DNA-methyltransferase PglX [bacterium]|nr:BREX-1 system adenine-specific DNA-methyltransferase PglX [bacterium]MCY3889191.1 BREX-1 system adenine-specific DNA-methyltransferase PglX [bacterium]
MTEALTADQRTKLERFIGRARTILEESLTAQAAGRFGIDSDGSIADETTLRLDPSELVDRREIVEVVEHLRSEGNSADEAVARLVREAGFTHLNRLVAIRIAEALGILPESLAAGERSQGYRDVQELVPLLAADETNGYWAYLRLCGDELAGDVPNLFDPRNALLTLSPSPVAIRDLVAFFADAEYAELWAAPDCLGWAYQFFNTEKERRAMREAAAAPRNSRELAVRNQFFTPGYVVDFLVQNSLGRRLLDADPNSQLIDDLPLLVDPPAQQGEPIQLEEIRVLDPACGSGHFLLAAYDLLERAWQHSGVSPTDAASHIVGSLWGIEIDPRCTQVASAAILFRARRSCPTSELPRPNVICARSLPPTATGLDELLANLNPIQRTLIRALTDALQDAPILGPLLRVEEGVESSIRASIAGTATGSLAEAIGSQVVADIQDELLVSLQAVADAATATPAERMLAAEADDAVRFVVAVLQRYDAVLQNPPFGEPVPETKPYLKAAYPWIPTKDCNLLAAFVGRGLELCHPGVGYVGAITSRAGMFNKTFESWRREILFRHQLIALADLGSNVMEQALVEAAAYVLQAVPATLDQQATFVRLLKETDRPAALDSAISADRSGEPDGRVFHITLKDLRSIPGWRVAYWMSPAFRRLFSENPSLEGQGAMARQGLASGDDFRFIRAFWEIDPLHVGRSREETSMGKRWVPFAKGGEYSPFWADIHLVLDYGNDGHELRLFDGSVIRNLQYYYRPGLTWPLRTNSGFGVRVLPAGMVFGHKGPAIIPSADPCGVLGWLTSRAVQASMDALVAAGEETTSGSASRSYEVGLVQNLPWISALEADPTASLLTSEIARLSRLADVGEETSRLFQAPSLLPHLVEGASVRDAVLMEMTVAGERHLQILEQSQKLERHLHELAHLDSDAEAYLDEEVGPHPLAYSEGPVNEQQLGRYLSEAIDRVIKELIERRGGSRAIANLTFFADRRLEVIAHGLERPPSQIEGFRRKASILPDGELARSSSQIVSYLVGAAFGRWDVRTVGVEPVLGDLFDPVPIHSPGMLLDDGEPARKAPAGYELDLPPGQLLLDQPGHDWDIVNRVMAVASLLLDDTEALIADLISHLKGNDLRDHLRKHFFKDHLSRYSKSRRKAPIYWPLHVPSGGWGAWIYAPSLSRETLYALEAAAASRLNAAEAEISQLRRDRESGASGRSARELASALDAEQRLAEELLVFSQEAGRVAALGWVPDLDDGIILCAAPLAGLLPAWKEAARELQNIKAGNYPWATVSKWADEL